MLPVVLVAVQVLVLVALLRAVIKEQKLVLVIRERLVSKVVRCLFSAVFLRLVHHFHARFGFESSGRLIGKDDFGFGDEGTGDGYTLLLSSRHLVRIMVGPLLQAQFF